MAPPLMSPRNFRGGERLLYEGRGHYDESHRCGDGYDFPKDKAKAKLFAQSDTGGAPSLAGYTSKILEFTADNCQVCRAVESAIVEMRKVNDHMQCL